MKHEYKKWLFRTIFILSTIVILTGSFVRSHNSKKSLRQKLDIFNELLYTISKDYVEETTPYDLIDDAIKGIVSNLDPHSTYMTEEHFKRWNQNFAGYSGIGIFFDILRNKITILSIFKNGPSDKTGLQAGDRIIAIDGKSVVGIKRDQVPMKLMGRKGTKVKVTVERRDWTQPKDFIITRDEVHLESVPYAFMISSDVGYIKILRFSSTTSTELEKTLKKLESLGMKKLILDLRNNGGGYLDAAVEVVDKFLPRGKRIVYTKGRVKGSFREFFATGEPTHSFKPIIVLIDRISASSSEIVAGALQDWDRAIVVGETSFGKGLVQSQYIFNDGSALLMTTARYYTPTGRLIQRPYNNKSMQEYYSEVANDSIRKSIGKDPESPSFRTKILEREVYGGGGITPDIFLNTRTDTVSPVMRRMLRSPQRFFFTFVQDYLKSNSEIRKDFNDFLRNYQPTDKIMQNFLGYIQKLEFEITEQEFLQNEQDIQFVLKQTIAAKIWGEEAQYKVQMLRDYQLVEALNYFDVAEKLLVQAYTDEDKEH